MRDCRTGKTQTLWNLQMSVGARWSSRCFSCLHPFPSLGITVSCRKKLSTSVDSSPWQQSTTPPKERWLRFVRFFLDKLIGLLITNLCPLPSMFAVVFCTVFIRLQYNPNENHGAFRAGEAATGRDRKSLQTLRQRQDRGIQDQLRQQWRGTENILNVIPEVPNPMSGGWCWSVGHLVPGHSEFFFFTDLLH